MSTGTGFERAPASVSSESFTGYRVNRPADHAAIPAGTLIADKYRVERVLGEGAMGIVLAARHLELDELVAIKCIRAALPWSSDVIARFAREAKACARLKSEHVAKVLDVGVSAPVGPYMVMEYLEGQDLAAVLKQYGPLPVRRAAEYVMQICEALALAHAASITHRDVKPENLFLTRHGDLEIIKVLDFGISKAPLAGRAFGNEISVKETSFLMGTPLYMSPEQIRSTREVDHRSDLWSLGVVLFELLTGRPAFAGETVTQVCALVLEANAPRLVEFCKGAPEGLGAVIERCLKKDPAERFQSAAELANALLPFAPARARLHAERANSVGRSPAPEWGLEPLPSTLPEGGRGERRPSVGTAAPTVVGTDVVARSGVRHRSILAILLTSGACLATGFLGWRTLKGSRDSQPSGANASMSSAGRPEARAPDAPTPEPPHAAPEVRPAPDGDLARTVPARTPSAPTRKQEGARNRGKPRAPSEARAAAVKASELAALTPQEPPKPASEPTARPAPPRARLLEERARVRLVE